MAINVYRHADATATGGTYDGTTWATAFREAELETFLEGTVVAGDVVFLRDSDFALDSAWDSSARDGTAASPIALIGVKSTCTHEGSAVVYSDWARLSADRPFIDGGANAITFGDYYVIRNISFQGEAINVVTTGTYSVIENCKFENDYGSAAARYSLNITTYTKVLNCEFTGANTHGLYTSGSNRILFNYFHDLATSTNGYGITLYSLSNVVAFNIFDTMLRGVFVDDMNHTIVNNTFYNCVDGIYESTNYNGHLIMNNILEGCTSHGIYSATQYDLNFYWKNHGNDTRNVHMWHNVDTTTIYKDYGVSTGDPLFATAGSDFSLQAGSPCLNNGMSITLGV